MYNALTLFCTLLLSCAVDFTQAHRRLLMQPQWNHVVNVASRSYTSPRQKARQWFEIVTKAKNLAESLVGKGVKAKHEFLTEFMRAFLQNYSGGNKAEYQTALNYVSTTKSYPNAMQNATQWIDIVTQAKQLAESSIFVRKLIRVFLAEIMPTILQDSCCSDAEYQTAMFCLEAAKHILL